MELSKKQKTLINFKRGPSWSSFEKLRQDGASALSPVKNGLVATLQTENGKYRILEEQDFQKLYGLAKDVNRLQNSTKIVIYAARAAQKHPDDPDVINTLIESITLLGSIPELPTRQQFEPLMPENDEFDEDDEVILDPVELKRLIEAEKALVAKND